MDFWHYYWPLEGVYQLEVAGLWNWSYDPSTNVLSEYLNFFSNSYPPLVHCSCYPCANDRIFSVCTAIRCIIHEGKSNQTLKQCDSNFEACSVLWTGPTAKEAVITSRACWNHAETKDQDICPFGPCIPKKLGEKVRSFKQNGTQYPAGKYDRLHFIYF